MVRPGGRVVVGELARCSLWAAERRVEGWRGSTTWRAVHFTTAGELRQLFRSAGATAVEARHGLYLPPWGIAPLVRRADAIERLGRRLGPLGAAFVVVRAEVACARRIRSSPQQRSASGRRAPPEIAGTVEE